MLENQKSILAEAFQSLAASRIETIDYYEIIMMISGCRVLPFDIESEADLTLMDGLVGSIRDACRFVCSQPIESRRPNEVGNKIEVPVRDSINQDDNGLKAETPAGPSGRMRSVGYPDLLITDSHENYTYLEIKTYNASNINSSMRSFYLSPSQDFKVTKDARHLLCAFEIVQLPEASVAGSNLYVPVRFKLLSLENLRCKLKLEINASNRDLYSLSPMIADEHLDA